MELKEATKRVKTLLDKTILDRNAFQWEYLDEDIRALGKLIDLASSVIAVSGILPKKYSKEQIEEGSKQDLIIGASMNFTGGYNKALSDVVIALTGRFDVEKIIEILNEKIDTCICSEGQVGESCGICERMKEEIAQALREYFMGEEEK